MIHILVVEDDENISVFMRRILERRLGCRVSITASPDEAMAVLESGPVAAIVMDVSLNGASLAGEPCDGVELSRHIRRHARHRTIPILLATAHAMRGDAERLLAASEADAYISKPFVDGQALIEPLRKLLAA